MGNGVPGGKECFTVVGKFSGLPFESLEEKKQTQTSRSVLMKCPNPGKFYASKRTHLPHLCQPPPWLEDSVGSILAGVIHLR